MEKPNFFICGSPKAGTKVMYCISKEYSKLSMFEYEKLNYFYKKLVGVFK